MHFTFVIHIDHGDISQLTISYFYMGLGYIIVFNFWPTILSVEPLVTVSSVCLSSVCRLSSVTFCIVVKRYVLAKNCLKE